MSVELCRTFLCFRVSLHFFPINQIRRQKLFDTEDMYRTYMQKVGDLTAKVPGRDVTSARPHKINSN